MNNTISFSEAIKECGETNPHLLLGNGFSISLFPNLFSYSSLLNEADFKNRECAKEVFEILKTSDFERVIKSLRDTASIIPTYSSDNAELSKKIKDDSDFLKNLLVETITKNHPEKINEINEDKFNSCNRFLSHFNKIYTLNYDLLLYWSLLHQNNQNPIKIDDGFRNPDDEFGADYRIFDSPHSPTFWYLHGGLHIFDAKSDVRKYVWSDTGKPIMNQVKEALDKEMYPLFVAEGSSDEKMEKISHSAYLSKALRSFEAICRIKKSEIFIFGHSLADNDKHILDKISKGNVQRVFIGLFRQSADEEYDIQIVRNAEKLKAGRGEKNPLEIIYYDSKSANIWNRGLV